MRIKLFSFFHYRAVKKICFFLQFDKITYLINKCSVEANSPSGKIKMKNLFMTQSTHLSVTSTKSYRSFLEFRSTVASSFWLYITLRDWVQVRRLLLCAVCKSVSGSYTATVFWKKTSRDDSTNWKRKNEWSRWENVPGSRFHWTRQSFLSSVSKPSFGLSKSTSSSWFMHITLPEEPSTFHLASTT